MPLRLQYHRVIAWWWPPTARRRTWSERLFSWPWRPLNRHVTEWAPVAWDVYAPISFEVTFDDYHARLVLRKLPARCRWETGMYVRVMTARDRIAFDAPAYEFEVVGGDGDEVLGDSVLRVCAEMLDE